MEFFSRLFVTSDFMPRWNCGSWSDAHAWLHIVSDLSIFAAYFAIPVVLSIFVLRRDDVPFPRIFWLFAAFIFSCGLGHLVEATLFIHPWYRLSGLVKVIIAVVSWASVIGLVFIMPQALKLPGLARQVDERTQQLAGANAELERINNLFVNRELKMIDLKREINQLHSELGKPPPYDLTFSEPQE